MTVAVCLACGAFKHGAWTPCPACGHTPEDDEGYTKHLLASDHHLARPQLEAIAAKVKAGERVDFPPDVLAKAWVRRADVDRRSWHLQLGCAGFLVALVLTVVGIVHFLRR